MKRRRNRFRKQRVALRERHKSELKGRFRRVCTRTAIFAVGAGAALGLAIQSDSVCAKFVRAHTPKVEVKASPLLGDLSVVDELPKPLILLWIPGAGRVAQKRILLKYPAVKAVHFQRSPASNHILLLLEPRTPLLEWSDRGMDAEGFIFPIQPAQWQAIPKATFAPPANAPLIGRWLAAISKRPLLWGEVVAVGQDRLGNMILELKTGTKVVWGAPDAPFLGPRLTALAKVLQDAHEHLGGAALADLRFFDEGRIIVGPKRAAGK